MPAGGQLARRGGEERGMKTIGYVDKCDGNQRLHEYIHANTRQKRHDRITAALTELRTMGNIKIYLIDGRHYRLLLTKGM